MSLVFYKKNESIGKETRIQYIKNTKNTNKK